MWMFFSILYAWAGFVVFHEGRYTLRDESAARRLVCFFLTIGFWPVLPLLDSVFKD